MSDQENNNSDSISDEDFEHIMRASLGETFDNFEISADATASSGEASGDGELVNAGGAAQPVMPAEVSPEASADKMQKLFEQLQSGKLPPLDELKSSMSSMLGQDGDQLVGELTNPFSQVDANSPIDKRIVTETAFKGSPSEAPITLEKDRQYKSYVTSADLWLDSVTEFGPTLEPIKVLTKKKFLEESLEQWIRLNGPINRASSQIASNNASDMEKQIDQLKEQFGADPAVRIQIPGFPPINPLEHAGSVSETVKRMNTIQSSINIGRALRVLSDGIYTSFDIDYPLLGSNIPAVVPANIEALDYGSGIDVEEIAKYYVLREKASTRLFASAAWLEEFIVQLVEDYAQTLICEERSRVFSANEFDSPEAIQKMINANREWACQPEQQKAREKLEHVLSVVEAWVDCVTLQAGITNLPHFLQIHDHNSRRRVLNSPINQVFGLLMHVQLNGQHIDAAVKFFEKLHARLGAEGRDEVWSHPDKLPLYEDLAIAETAKLIDDASSGDEDFSDVDNILGNLFSDDQKGNDNDDKPND